MAQQNWVVYAYSPSLNQQVRQFILAEMNRPLTEQQAHQHAVNFAQLQNTNKYMHATDWCAKIQNEQHGIETLDGFLFAS